MKQEVIFLALCLYTIIIILMTGFLLIGSKPNENYGKLIKDYIQDLFKNRNIIGIVYSLVLFILILPVTFVLVLVHIIKTIINKIFHIKKLK